MPKSLRSPQQQRLQEMLIQARKVKKLTQADIAARLKRPQSYVSKYESGERRLDVIEFVAVAAVLDVNPYDILIELMSEPRRKS